MEKEKRRKNIWDRLYVLLIAAIVIMIPVFAYEGYKYYTAKQAYDQIPEMSDLPEAEEMEVLDVEPDLWPEDSLFVERARSEYKSGGLRLIIPKMGVDDDVMDGTDTAALKHGPGLYSVAQLPGEGRKCNTSIAGHRAGYGRYGNIFKEIHTMQEGDNLYLTDKKWIYCYEYRDTKITKPDDISVLYLQDYPCLTLTSCNPLGKNTERIILKAELTKIVPYEEDFTYNETGK